ncbi:MAG: TonB-dependent receptor domain-containing protein [Alphaproteobacteria bacterium]
MPSGPLGGLLDPDPAVRQAIEDGLIFESETSEGGEIGVKAQFADSTFSLNTVFFYYVFDNLQVQNFNVAIFNFDTFNASELTTKGIDMDWAWQTPVDGLVLSGAVSYTDTKYTDTFIPTAEDLQGRAAARAPKWSGNIAFDWFTPVGNALEFGFSGNLAFSSAYFANDDTFDDDFRNSGYVTLDLSVSLGDPSGRWKVSVIGTNLTDEIWVNTSGAAPFRGTGDDLVLTQNRGRQIFLEAAFRY